MEWLKDKKNLPVVAGLGVLVLVLAIAAILFETGVIGGGGAPADTTATAAPPPPVPAPASDSSSAPAASAAPGAAAGPGKPGAQAAKPAAKVAVSVTKGPDPFSVPIVNKPASSTTVRPSKPPVSSFVQPIYISSVSGSSGLPNTNGTNGTAPPPLSVPNIRLNPEESQTMRVSGVVLTNGSGIRAVLEANGQSLTVQPGDTVPGGRVISIQSDGLTMKADNGQLIHVPISSG